ncbi:MAG: hypothetical protein ACRD9L_01160 [Bryobacteraceae bacterium]
MAVCVYSISYAPELPTLDIDRYSGRQVLLLLFLIAMAQTSDVL